MDNLEPHSPTDDLSQPSSWTPRPLVRRPVDTRTGWLVVDVGAGILLLVAAWMALDAATTGDPDDPGWADVAFFFSPFLAIISAFLTGFLLTIVAVARRISVTVSRAVLALVIGVIGGPIAYVVVLLAVAYLVEPIPMIVLAALTFMVPAACGAGITLAAAHPLRQSSSAT